MSMLRPTGRIAEQGTLRGVDLRSLSYEEFEQIEGRLEGAVHRVLFDSLLIEQGRWQESVIKLFAVPVGEQITPVNGSHSYVKDNSFTNMILSSRLPKGDQFAIKAVAIDFISPSSSFDKFQRRVLEQSIWMSLQIEDTRFEGGFLKDWPSREREKQIWNQAINIVRKIPLKYDDEGSPAQRNRFDILTTLEEWRDSNLPQGSLQLAKPRYLLDEQYFSLILRNETIEVEEPCRLLVSLFGTGYKQQLGIVKK